MAETGSSKLKCTKCSDWAVGRSLWSTRGQSVHSTWVRGVTRKGKDWTEMQKFTNCKWLKNVDMRKWLWYHKWKEKDRERQDVWNCELCQKCSMDTYLQRTERKPSWEMSQNVNSGAMWVIGFMDDFHFLAYIFYVQVCYNTSSMKKNNRDYLSTFSQMSGVPRWYRLD